ncbi:LapA family protein [Lentibacillus jeotgali]|uniref:LapA family protein n=1 Tax=Lentibacillus jeotgali TaxID=558169 RepID=UPI0002626C25|nr:lipopolysaccharide assembly protein LapA domain-containing protein [Lentibacillus jeotgali]
MRGQTYVILAIIFVLIVAIFAVINVDPVEVNYFFGSGEAPLILVILFSVLMGGIITAAVGLVKMIRLQRERNTLISENKQMKEILTKHGLHTTDAYKQKGYDQSANNKQETDDK